MRCFALGIAVGFGVLMLLGSAGRVAAALAPLTPPEISRHSALQPAPGRFLVARRSFLDPFFSRRVIWLLQHDARASFGLIVNQPSDRQLASVSDEFGDTPYAALPVSHGGPVDPGMLVILVRSAVAPEPARHVVADVYASINPRLLLELPDGNPDAGRLRLFLGHAGWTPGQLEAEVQRGYWHVVEGDPAVVFGAASGDLWETMIRSLEPASADTPDAPAW